MIMLLRTITCLFPSIPNLFLCMLQSRYVNARNFKPIEFIGWQQATLNFKDTLEDSCWSQQDCSLKCSSNSIPELFLFFQLNLQVFRIVPSAPKQKGQLLHLHLPQVVSSCQMKILSLVDYICCWSLVRCPPFCHKDMQYQWWGNFCSVGPHTRCQGDCDPVSFLFIYRNPKEIWKSYYP